MESTTLPLFELRVLGGCEILGPQGAIRFESAKTTALLVYLALNPGAQSRHKLMGLLWGDLPEEKARRNLRHALWDLRRKLNLPGKITLIQAKEQSIAFNRNAGCVVDADEFQAASQQFSPASPLAAFDLQAAADSYRGDFLDGFFVAGSPPFDEWALLERERLRMAALSLLERLADGYAALGDAPAAISAARRALALDAWREESHRRLMHLLAQSGDRSAALAQYEACRSILAEALGVEPTPETAALVERIKTASTETAEAQVARLPAQSTPFFGRAEELAQIAGLLQQPDCRLVTLTGPGGIGKTRLAVRAAGQMGAAQHQQFPHGIYFVPLAAISDTPALVAAIAQAMRFTFFGPDAPRVQIINYLRHKKLLLVLDNFEQLLTLPMSVGDPSSENAPLFLAEMLRSASEIKLLVTSRERLNIQEEWVFLLEGLKYPQTLSENMPEVDLFPAIQLFLQSARRARLGFSLNAVDRLHVVNICQRVEGLPLAIELAAAWVRALSCEQILHEIETRLEFLESGRRDYPLRHRSLEAVFDYSWQLLTPIEQTVFPQLSVFRGGFDRQAAESVAGATLASLTALVDKSLVRWNAMGRYELHELLRKFASRQLEKSPDLSRQAGSQHSRYYAGRMQALEEFSRRNPQSPEIEELSNEYENFIAAGRRAVEQHDLLAVDQISRGFYFFLHGVSAYRAGESLFGTALETLGWADMDRVLPEAGLLPWKLLAYHASFAVYLGQHLHACAVLQRCLKALEGADPLTANECRFFLGESARFTGEYPRAREYLQASLDGYQQLGNRGGMALALSVLGTVALSTQEYAQARQLFSQSLEIFKSLGAYFGQMLVSLNLGALYKGMGDMAAAEQLFREALPLCQKTHHRWGSAYCYNHLGDIERMRGQFDAARDAYQEGLRLIKDIGQPQGIIRCLTNLGIVSREQGDISQARSQFVEALQMAQSVQAMPLAYEALFEMALLLEAQGDVSEAEHLLNFIQSTGTEYASLRERAIRETGRINATYPLAQTGNALEDWQYTSLVEIIQRLAV